MTGKPAAGIGGWTIAIELDGDLFAPVDQGADSVYGSALEMVEESVIQERLIREPGKPDRVGPGFAFGGQGLEAPFVVDAGRNGGRQGVVAFGVLSQRQPVALPRTCSATILNIQVAPWIEPTVDKPVVSGRLFISGPDSLAGEPTPTTVVVDRENAHVCRGQRVNVSFVLRTAPLIRCDTNADGKLDIADAVWILQEAFRGGPETRCPEAADCNGDGRPGEVTDVLAAIDFLLLGGPSPPSPFPECARLDLELADCPAGSTACPPEA